MEPKAGSRDQTSKKGPVLGQITIDLDSRSISQLVPEKLHSNQRHQPKLSGQMALYLQ